MSRVRRTCLLITSLVIAACVEPISPVAKIVTITPRLATMVLGDSVQLAAAVRSATGVPVTWKTSADSVLTVSAAGLVRAVGPGTAVVTATVGFGSDTMSVDVTVRFARLGMSPSAVVCAVATTGDAFCRGPNYYGMLGNGSTVASPTFVRVVGAYTFTTVEPNGEWTCGLRTDSAAYCWGYGGVGGLGVGDTNTRLVPTPIGGAQRFARVVTGDLHTCGLTVAGAAQCWGWGYYGQTGDSTLGNALTPRAVPGAPAFAELATGGFGTCGITAAHAAYCWGLNYYGQLGAVTDTNIAAPTPMAGGHAFSSLAVHEMQCGLATSGSIYCWGLPFALSPKPIDAGGLHFTSISAAYTDGCGIATDSSAHCWDWRMKTSPLPGGLKFAQLASGGYHACGVGADSAAYCWLVHCGVDYDVGCSEPPAPAALPGGIKFTQVTAGSDNDSCGLDPGGTVYCWFYDRDRVLSPVAVPSGVFREIALGSGLAPVTVASGSKYGCGLAADSTASCWGFHIVIQGGQLVVATAAPTAVPGNLKYISLDTWAGRVCGIAVGGSAYCWARPDAGPVLVPGGGTFVKVYVDFWSTCALDAAGTASCWGRNLEAELGLGWAGIQSSVPLPVLGGHAFTAIAPAYDHTCGLATDSTAYCWGSNSTGMLGTGDTTWSIPPVPVAGGLHFAALATGPYLSCGLISDGSAYCWGRGSLTPAQQQVGTHFISLSANSYVTICGVTTAGAVQCWDAGPYVRAAARRGRL